MNSVWLWVKEDYDIRFLQYFISPCLTDLKLSLVPFSSVELKHLQKLGVQAPYAVPGGWED